MVTCFKFLYSNPFCHLIAKEAAAASATTPLQELSREPVLGQAGARVVLTHTWNQPGAHTLGLLGLNVGPLWGIVASGFRLFGF